jgi:type VI secretion system protein ImpC
MDYAVSFGRISKASRVQPGPAFRLALLGDFSGRAGAAAPETGAKLASRKPRRVDVDNLETLIEQMNVSIAVPVGDEGEVVSVPIKSMDDFHPDQLVENVPFLEELLRLRKNLQSKSGFDRAAKEVLSWSGETALPPPERGSAGGTIATDRKLSDFARLTGRAATVEADSDELIRRLVGPFIVPARDQRQDALVARVDEALSAAMRRVLHHPNFQTVEAVWRGLEFLVRRIETSTKLQIVVYDITAEELAADLAASDKLDESGLYSLLVEQPAMDANQGALSVIAGLYQWELTPPHADLLGRVAQVAAAAGAPFVGGVGPDYLMTPVKDWHPMVKQAWDSLRALPASAYLGLTTPRFLLRIPYGKRTDPIDAFVFEEFTRQAGLSGMLWGHPALLTANLLAETWLRDSKAMKIGSIATVDDIPVYVYHDTDGEQIALPCAERMYNERQAVLVTGAGVNPVISIRGRPEVRMGGFASLAGATLAGRWAPVELKPAAPPAPPPPAAKPAAAAPAKPAAPPPQEAEPEEAAPEPVDTSDLDALLANLGATDDAAPATDDAAPAAEPAAEPTAEPTAEEAAAADDDLDALLASLNAKPEPAAEDETEADLDALLASLK